MSVNILLADDHGLFRDCMKAWLTQLSDDFAVHTAMSLNEVLGALDGERDHHLVLLDLGMPGMQGAEGVRTVHESASDTPIIVVSAEDNPAIMRACLDAGAAGYVPKSSAGETIIHAIRQVLAGYCHIPAAAQYVEPTPRFSPRQIRILSLLSEGLSNREIAARICRSEGTVKQYVSELLRKLDVGNRTQAVIKARTILGIGN